MTDYYKDKQQLTDEQVAELAPDWCTHYEMKELEKPVGLVVQFQDERYFTTLFVDHKSLNLGRKLIHHGLSRGAKPIPRKKFDISEYEFSDWCGEYEKVDSSDLSVNFWFLDREHIKLNKNDAIALAKHFNLTAEDLR